MKKKLKFIVVVEKNENDKTTSETYITFEEKTVGAYFKGGHVVECRQIKTIDKEII